MGGIVAIWKRPMGRHSKFAARNKPDTLHFPPVKFKVFEHEQPIVPLLHGLDVHSMCRRLW